MIPAEFDYVAPDTLEDAISAALQGGGEDAKLLAGGHSLLPLMKLRLASPALLVDIGRLRDLCHVRDSGDQVAIGALTRHRDLETSGSLRSSRFRCWPTPRAPWATPRSATAAPSGGQSPTATRRRTSRRWSWPSGRPW